MIKWVVIALAGYLLFRLFSNDFNRKKGATTQQKDTKEQKIANGELVQDPTCKTYVDAESNITVREGEKIHRFCSYECRDAFVEERKKQQALQSTE